MRRKLIGIVTAVVLATLGTVALVAYVQQAKDDAVADEAEVTVLVLTETVRQGAPADEIADAVTPTAMPVRLQAPDALTTVDQIGDLVSAVELRAGEQLLASRLVEAEQLVRVDVPAGLQEITIGLDPERALGANVEPGDVVGVLLSFEPFEMSTSGEPVSADTNADAGVDAPTKTPNMTHLALNEILVTGVQLSQSDRDRVAEVSSSDDDAELAATATVAEAPGEQVLITLAVSAPEAEQIVFAAEFGSVWLTGQNAATDAAGSRIVTLAQAYVAVPRS